MNSFSTRCEAKTENCSRGSRRAGIRNSRRRNPGAPGFNALPPDQRAKEKKPAKHRFPVDFHRGLELFGQHASRLDEPGYREAIVRCGIIVVEGFNDMLGLDAIGVPAVAIMSNKITDEQVAKVERWATSLSGGRVTLLFDADDAGDAGAKEALWLFAERGLDVRLGWSQAIHSGKFKGRQPESLPHEEWTEMREYLDVAWLRPVSRRSVIPR